MYFSKSTQYTLDVYKDTHQCLRCPYHTAIVYDKGIFLAELYQDTNGTKI